VTHPGFVDTVTSAERRARYVASGAWDDETLSARLSQHAAASGDLIAVVDSAGQRRRTYGELEVDARRVASLLAERGLEPGDVVAIQLPSWYEAIAVALGALRAGAIVNPMLPIYRTRELNHMLGIAATRFLFTPATYRGVDHRELVAALDADVRSRVEHLVVDDPSIEESPFLESLKRFGNGNAGVPRSAGEISGLFFTSGTEAEPKAVLHTEQTANFTVRSVAASLGIGAEDVVWMPSPVGHSTGFNMGARMTIFHGLKLVLQDRWDPDLAAALVEQERCTYTSAAATFLSDLLAAGERLGADLSSLRLFRCGGAPVPPELVADAASQGISVLRIYGSTEILAATSNRVDSPLAKRLGTDGRALEGVEVAVRRDDGSDASPGEAGEIVVRGPNTAAGFLRDPLRTGQVFEPDGWVRSGDLGTIDDSGYLTVVGRKKEIIIRGGLNIAPREVEELLLQMPHVTAAAVVGLPHPRLGETSCAFVVADTPGSVTFELMIAHLREAGLAPFKLPERLELVDALPLTATGKIQKHVLAASLAG
jgi:acyl-CoA synthetase (AMP-forming)/AMP-acid ligase II